LIQSLIWFESNRWKWVPVAKIRWPMRFNIPGMSTDWNNKDAYARDSIRADRESDSSEIDERELWYESMMIQKCQCFLELRSIEMVTMKMLLIQFELIMNLIQMKSMKHS
jgi:hypothetical protein